MVKHLITVSISGSVKFCRRLLHNYLCQNVIENLICYLSDLLEQTATFLSPRRLFQFECPFVIQSETKIIKERKLPTEFVTANVSFFFPQELVMKFEIIQAPSRFNESLKNTAIKNKSNKQTNKKTSNENRTKTRVTSSNAVGQ